MVKISIIVPVYNVENYICGCLDSLIRQSLKEIEIICINDGSQDKCHEIIQKYAKEDDRIITITFPENKGTLCARTQGVAKANGQYLMFVDSDDFLDCQACERLYLLMEKEQTDVIHFGTALHSGSNVSAEMIKWVTHFLTPYSGKLEGDNLLNFCFLQEKFDFNITNKIWKREICSAAFSKVQPQRLVASEDRYLFFLMAYYAKSYRGITDKFYHYNLGIGVTGGDLLTVEQFEKRCSGASASALVADFLESEHAVEQYEAIATQFANQILWDCVDCWFHKLTKSDSVKGFQILSKYFSPDAIVGALARIHFEQVKTIVKRTGIEVGSNTAIYCRYLGNQDLNHILQQIIALLKSQGSTVTICTDENQKDILDTSETFLKEVVYLPDSINANGDLYKERAKILYNMLKEKEIKVLFYASPASHVADYDMLLAAMSNITAIPINIESAPDNSGKVPERPIVSMEELSSPAIMFRCFVRACLHKIYRRK